MRTVEQIEAHEAMHAEIDRLRGINAELLAALRECESVLRWMLNSVDDKEIKDSFQRESKALDSARAAIAKATA